MHLVVEHRTARPNDTGEVAKRGRKIRQEVEHHREQRDVDRSRSQREGFDGRREKRRPDAPRTLVVMAHHDAARSGLIFHSGPQRWLGTRFPSVIEKNDTAAPMWWPVVTGAAMAALGGRRLRRVGRFMCATTALFMADIGRHDAVPGANDNLTGVAAVRSAGVGTIAASDDRGTDAGDSVSPNAAIPATASNVTVAPARGSTPCIPARRLDHTSV